MSWLEARLEAQHQREVEEMRAAPAKHDADKELLRQESEKRLQQPINPSDEDIESLFDQHFSSFSEGKKNENVWMRTATLPKLSDLECHQGGDADGGKCADCQEMMLGGSHRRYCKRKALAFVDTCLDDDGLKKLQRCYGFKYTLYNGYDDDDSNPFDLEEPEDISDKLILHPIGDKRGLFENTDECIYDSDDERDHETVHSFLSKPRVLPPSVAAKLLRRFRLIIPQQFVLNTQATIRSAIGTKVVFPYIDSSDYG